jgi:ATP-dependent exoDNAse (exonuclease V) alpha subunit
MRFKTWKSEGDKIRITKNGFDADKKRLNNGQTLEVVSVNKKGNVKVRNTASKVEYSLPRDYGHIAHAHCITSHASQGKTVDEVFIAQPSATFPATDLKQFYVSVSRGREAVHIYTDDKTALLDYASQIGDRLSALELVGTDHTKEMAERISREKMNRQSDIKQKAKAPAKTNPIEQQKAYEREPEI